MHRYTLSGLKIQRKNISTEFRNCGAGIKLSKMNSFEFVEWNRRTVSEMEGGAKGGGYDPAYTKTTIRRIAPKVNECASGALATFWAKMRG